MASDSGTRIIAIAGGKGGVGKTVCTANLALAIASRHPALAVDLDLGCGNLNTCLGVRNPQRNINEFLREKALSLEQVRTPTPLSTLQLVSCSYHSAKLISFENGSKERLLGHLRRATEEYTFLDLGAGISADILDFFAAADLKILVTNPESTAMHNAFLFLKAFVHRILSEEFRKNIFTPAIREKVLACLDRAEEGGMKEVFRDLKDWSPYAAYIVQGILSEHKICIILNKANRSRDEDYITKFYNLVKKYLNLELVLLGLVPYDRHVISSINSIRPLMLEYRRSSAARAFEEMSYKIEAAVIGS